LNWYDDSSFKYFDIIERISGKMQIFPVEKFYSIINSSIETLELQHLKKLPKLGIRKLNISIGKGESEIDYDNRDGIFKKTDAALAIDGLTVNLNIYSIKNKTEEGLKLFDHLIHRYGKRVQVNFHLPNQFPYGCGILHVIRSYPSVTSSLRKKECIMKHVNGFVIDEEGSIYKCFREVDEPQHKIGQLSDRTSNYLNHYIDCLCAEDAFESIKCKECDLLPICLGGCPWDKLTHNRCFIDFDRLKILFNNYFTDSEKLNQKYGRQTKIE